MKSNSAFPLLLITGALILGVPDSRAHGKHGHAHGAGTDSIQGKAAMNSQDGMAALHGHIQGIGTELAAGNLAGIHAHAEGIDGAIRNLDKDTSLSESKKKRVQGYIRNVTRIAGKLHHAADADQLEPAKKEFAKLVSQVDLLDRQFAHSRKSKAGGANPVPESAAPQGEK